MLIYHSYWESEIVNEWRTMLDEDDISKDKHESCDIMKNGRSC